MKMLVLSMSDCLWVWNGDVLVMSWSKRTVFLGKLFIARFGFFVLFGLTGI